jgi:diadenosine tetraphosphatase ApaH/serine/threonine PP2A family protein phosphatase/Ca2+-binding EF-hand superfamily protein
MWAKHTARYTKEYDIAASKILHCWRFVRLRETMNDTIFRLIQKEMELAREFSIVAAKKPATPTTRKRSQLTTRCTHDDIPLGHYFPRSTADSITLDVLKSMLNDFEEGVRLPYAAAWRVVEEAYQEFLTRRNIQYVTLAEGPTTGDGKWASGGKVIVVGDLHGQLHDLLHIIKENGMPGKGGTSYVFNGDIVDRGANSFEALMIIYTMMVVSPDHVFVNRGNHEVFYMNEDYGFDVEVATKYDRPMYHLVQRSFNAIPLGTCVSRKVLIVHGGVPRIADATLEFIDTINRFRPMPMPEPYQCDEDVTFQDILWSDPWDKPGIGLNERGAGILFGKDITERFLKTNELELLIRSHEPFVRGYAEHHNGSVVTIFSASNYDGENSNRASYAVICAACPEQPTYHTFQTHDLHELTMIPRSPLTPHRSKTTSFTQPCAGEVVLRNIREKIYQKRHQLLKFFNAIDATKKGTVWKVEWVEAMRTVISVDIPWFFLRTFLAETEGTTTRINYTKFLWRYQNKLMVQWTSHLEKAVVNKVACALDTRKRSKFLAEMQEKDESITFSEFERILLGLNIGIRDEEMFQLFTFFDQKFEGFLNVNQILRYVKEAPSTNLDNSDVFWELEVMQELQNIFISGRMSLEHAFRVMDSTGSGMLRMPQFVKGMTMLNRALRTPLLHDQMKDLYEMVDMDHDGIISFQDFANSFSVHDVVYEMEQDKKSLSAGNAEDGKFLDGKSLDGKSLLLNAETRRQ